MSNGKNPLMLMMALAMPGAVHALGLGDIHVDSSLNERLAAEIDLVGATVDELADLRAAVANRETFLRYGADRPAFLSSATFKVAHDTQGRPVLAIRSTEPFTEPLVNFLVDLRWRNGELVREYTLLLDPPGFAAVPAPLAPAHAPTVETKTQTVAQVEAPTAQPDSGAERTNTDRSARKTTQIKVGAKATLRGIAWRVGERSETDLQKMMIAIFRANPRAFDGNINRLHLGAVLTIPSEAELAAISAAEAKREVHEHMTAWRGSAAPAVAMANPVIAMPAFDATPDAAATPAAASTPAAPIRAAAAAAAVAPAVVAVAPAAADAAPPAPATAEQQALNRQVETLEQQLSEAKGLLESKNDQLLELEQQAIRAQKAAPAQPKAVKVQHTQSKPPEHASLVPAMTGIGILGAALAGLYFKLRRRKPKPQAQEDAASENQLDAAFVREAAPAQELPKFQPQPPPQLQPQLKPQAKAQPLPQPAKAAAQPTPPVDLKLDVSEDELALERAIEAAAIYEATHPMLPLVPDSPEAAREALALAEPMIGWQDATVALPEAGAKMPGTAAKLPAEPSVQQAAATPRVETRLDYNLVDLDMTVQHVHLPSALNENTVVKERRTNLADVLKLAIEREPNRNDLRMKLLELYFSQATTNRDGFLEVVQKLAEDRDYRQSADWEKIASMGRQIAADNPLFIDELVTEDDLSIERKSA